MQKNLNSDGPCNTGSSVFDSKEVKMGILPEQGHRVYYRLKGSDNTLESTIKEIRKNKHDVLCVALLETGDEFNLILDDKLSWILVQPHDAQVPEFINDILEFNDNPAEVIPVIRFQWITLADKHTGQTLYAEHTTVEHATVEFDPEQPHKPILHEGKPVMNTSETIYFVGDLSIEIPEDITINQYC